MNKLVSILTIGAIIGGISPSMAQEYKRVSPHETVSKGIDGNRVMIVYGRPYTKDPKTGQLASTVFPPHYMIYAPGLTNADIGMSREATTPGLPFVYSGYSGGSKTAYLIVMASTSVGHTMP